ncbi:Hpt domain-containing protein [Marivita geojedonensis]|uniref:HPt domain-containing protein n=1 Tax=Marivita geojedonensis TaxID=1123756 RepID=A0A1X4NHD6_9RHOB|nr:Hpt domain-containing protein [Marivita geojedonensis]OSQ46598.1 hypothetical protein MGEO_17275 [Marivita geojedonensis]PRY74195.1 Hpt domain-containing protein [Marivita geojedonensis]
MPSLAQKHTRPGDRAQGSVNLNARIAVIRENFLERLVVRSFELEDIVNDIEDSGLTPEAVAQLGHHAHKIAGVAATLGFPRLGSLAAQTDAAIVEGGSRLDWTSTHALVTELLTEMNSVLEEQRST